MSFAIIRGSNGRRHEVDFKDDPVAVDVSMSESVVQISIDAPRPGACVPGSGASVWRCLSGWAVLLAWPSSISCLPLLTAAKCSEKL